MNDSVITNHFDRIPLSKRREDAQKYDFGHVFIIGGDYGMSGAVLLAGTAALRAGAGMVTIITRYKHFNYITSNRPELMCLGFENTEEDISTIKEKINRATVIVIGPGLGKSVWGKSLLKLCMQFSNKRKILDADALNLIAMQMHETSTIFEFNLLNFINSDCVLTPHAGEAARLINCTVNEINANRVNTINKLKETFKCVVLLKGKNTLISRYGDIHIFQSDRGNPGMSTAGMGDVLAGIIASFIAQGLDSLTAARFGVEVHGMSADFYAKEFGERGMIASDVVDNLKYFVNPQTMPFPNFLEK